MTADSEPHDTTDPRPAGESEPAPATAGTEHGRAPGALAEEKGSKRSGKRYMQLSDRSRCRFTRAGVKRIDYKDVETLEKLLTAQGKILARKRTGIAARYQRMVKTAIKRARYMALLPYTG